MYINTKCFSNMNIYTKRLDTVCLHWTTPVFWCLNQWVFPGFRLFVFANGQKSQEKIDEDTGEEIICEEEQKTNRYKVDYVFDVSQTEGKKIPSLRVDKLQGSAKGCYSLAEKRIAESLSWRHPKNRFLFLNSSSVKRCIKRSCASIQSESTTSNKLARTRRKTAQNRRKAGALEHLPKRNS